MGKAAIEENANADQKSLETFFYCHLLPVGRQMAIKTTFFTFVNIINVLDCAHPVWDCA